MPDNEQQMIRPLVETDRTTQERFTSLQPTYEDSVNPDADEWEQDDDAS